MPTSNPTDILLTHNQWATHSVLDACAQLTDEQFHRRFEMGPGSLHDTLMHVLGAMRGWADLLAQRPRRDRVEAGGPYAIEQLKSLLDDAHDDLVALVKAHPIDGEITGERGGDPYMFTRGAILTHVTTHGMHHRAQCLNMLRQMDVEKLPPTAVLEWLVMVDGQG